MRHSFLLLLFLVGTSVLVAQQPQKISDNLSVIQLSNNAYLHVGMLETTSFGRVGCNGLVYIDKKEAVVLDTPPDTAQTRALLHWIETAFPGTKIKAVIVNHFHDDCLAGLPVFHEKGIPSYANRSTRSLAVKHNVPVPQKAFDGQLTLMIGGSKVVNRFFGEAHTKDNIVSWIPAEKMLFGGCMIKSLGAAKGNLADANEKAWSYTVKKVKEAYPRVRLVVPGHGDIGGKDLLDYTIRLFQDATQQK